MRLPPSPLAPTLHQREKERKIYWQDERGDQVFRRRKKNSLNFILLLTIYFSEIQKKKKLKNAEIELNNNKRC